MKKLLSVLVLGMFILTGCMKEVSFETGGSPSAGLLQSDITGDCLPKNVVGVYVEGTALNGNTNYIEVSVDVTTAGNYTIYSDTSNGVYFRATGVFTSTGTNVVKLRGNATPASDGTFNFVIQYDGQSCAVPVEFLPTGAGGPAAFTFNCTPAPTPAGSYVVGTAVNATNKVVMNVNVTTPGTYTVTSTTVNGLTFSGSGALSATGAGTITLTATGTPTAANTSTYAVTVGASTCSFPVTSTGPAVFVINCASANILGDYVEGQALTNANTVSLTVNVTTPGAYSISTAAVNGMVFAGSGTLAAGTQTILLTGSGTPAADGNSTINVNAGTTPCSFQITVDPTTGATGTWKFTEGTTTYQGTLTEAQFDVTSIPPFLLFYTYGTNATGEEFEIDLLDISGTINAGETYNMATFTGAANAGGMYFIGVPPKTYDADPSFPTNTMVATVTSHNTATKTMSGTFTGKAEDNNGVLKTITNGTFTVTYQ